MAAWGLGSIMVPGLIALGGVRLALVGTGVIVPIIVLTRFSRLLHIDSVATVPVVAIAPNPLMNWRTAHMPMATIAGTSVGMRPRITRTLFCGNITM